MTEDNLFVYFCGSTLLTLLISTSILALFSKDALSRLFGLFAVKPVIAYGLGVITLFIGLGTWTGFYIRYAVVEFCLSLVIFFQFKTSYHKYFWLLWLLALLDFTRWGSVLFILASTDIFGVYAVDRNMARTIFSEILIYSVLFALFSCFLCIVRYQKLRSVREIS